MFKKRYLTTNDIEPLGEEISTVDAKRIYKKYMLDIGHISKEDIADHVSDLAESIKYETSDLREELKDEKDQLNEYTKDIKRLTKKLETLKNKDKIIETECEIEYLQEEYETQEKHIAEARAKLDKFLKDKRLFLVEYINLEVHGHASEPPKIQKPIKVSNKSNSIKPSLLTTGHRYKFSYIDGSDNISNREATLNKIISKNGLTYLECYCHSQRDQRTFRLDRVSNLINMGTGEFIGGSSSQITGNTQSQKVSILLCLGIFFIPIIFSWFTIQSGYSSKARIISFVWLALTLILWIL